MTASALGNRILPEAASGAVSEIPDYRPVLPVGGTRPAAGFRTDAAWVEASLEDPFRPESATLVSFLVNALYLIGDQGILAYGGLDESATSELARLGHQVEAVPADLEIRPSSTEARGPAGAGIRGAKGSGQATGAKNRDRAVALASALGRGSDGEVLERLRAMGKALRPGGLLAFHVFDRDRAWNQAGERRLQAGGREARVRVGFDPDSGRISARLLGTTGPGGDVRPGCGSTLSVKARNLPEIRDLLRAAGLVLERAYGGWNGGSPETEGAATGRLIIVAAKPRRPGKRRQTVYRPG